MKTKNRKAADSPAGLHLITGILNRELGPIVSFTATPMDTQGIVLIAMEINVDETALQPLLSKLGNIVEIFEVEAVPSH